MSESNCSWQCERMILSNCAAGREWQEEVVAHLERSHWPEREIFSVRLALEEAIANAVKHGNRLDPSKHIRLACRLEGPALHVEVADEGPGFDPDTVPDPRSPERLEEPSGRGIMLMRSFMECVEYCPPGNCVKLEKRFPSADPHG